MASVGWGGAGVEGGMYSKIFTANILFCYKHIHQHTNHVIMRKQFFVSGDRRVQQAITRVNKDTDLCHVAIWRHYVMMG